MKIFPEDALPPRKSLLEFLKMVLILNLTNNEYFLFEKKLIMKNKRCTSRRFFAVTYIFIYALMEHHDVFQKFET